MSFGEGYCGDARRVMVNKYKATWNSWYSGLEPHVGDLVYYGVRGSDESSHVGLVVSVDKTEKKYTSIEGNILVNGNKFVKKTHWRLFNWYMLKYDYSRIFNSCVVK